LKVTKNKNQAKHFVKIYYILTHTGYQADFLKEKN